MARLAPLAAMLAALGLPAVSFAQAGPVRMDRSFEGDLFQPAIGPKNFLRVDSPVVVAHRRLSYGLFFDYQRRPYKIATYDFLGAPLTSAYPIENQFKSELHAAIGLSDRFQIGLALPVTLALSGDTIDPSSGMPTGTQSSTRGFGDLRLEAKGQLVTAGPDDQLVMAALIGGSLPTGKESYYLGDRGPTGRAKAIASWQLGRLRLGGELGVLVRQTSTTLAAKVGSQLLYGAAAAFAVSRRVEILGEIVGRSGLSEMFDFWWDQNPVESQLAARVYPINMVAVTAGVGAGLGRGIGAPQARAFLGVVFVPDFRDADGDGVYDADDRCGHQPEDRDGFKDDDGCPDPDNDGDGIDDLRDRCPNDAEDFDQIKDDDGCPDADNDGDGIDDLHDPCPMVAEDGRGKRPTDGCPWTTEDSDGDGVSDATDKCADEAEDRDGFEDDDGCGDPDNDNDGIPDGFDACPSQAEDADGFEDDDGCPDLDNDKDGYRDSEDKCPREAETLNGNRDEDGCPDAGTEIVRITPERIVVTGEIGFVTRAGRPQVRDSSGRLVKLVALVLKGHTEIRKLRVSVQAVGVPEAEAQRRAEAIVQLLVGAGVEADRLTAAGAAGPNQVDFGIVQIEPAGNAKDTPGQEPVPAGTAP